MLITKAHRFYDGHYISNEYRLSIPSGRWSAVRSTPAVFSLQGTVFAVYLYLCCCRNRRQRAFPSLRQIAARLDICKTTVLRGISFLTEIGLLTKAAYRAGKHNLYIILPFTDISDKKKRASALPGVGPHSTKIGHHSHFCIFILSFFSVFVKDFSMNYSSWNAYYSRIFRNIFLGKAGHFLDNSLYPPKLTRQRKKSKSLSGT